ncbi:MAG: hypothetical protein ABUL42_01945 [Terricaulis silvestris]
MSPRSSREVKTGSQARMVAVSFAGGVAAMALAGLVCTVVAGGGLSLSAAHAAPLSHHVSAPAVAPLDVAAIQAQLAQSDSDMRQTQNATDGAMTRLQSLSN